MDSSIFPLVPGKVYRVQIQEKHLEKGTPGSSYFCPLALALKEQFGIQDGGVLVTLQNVYIFFRCRKYQLKNSVRLTAFIRRFDKGEAVQPFRGVLRAF